MLDLTGVNGVIRGEPESTVGDLAAGCDWLATPGLTFRRDGQVVSTAERPPLDMTTLPLPALHLLDLRHYSYEILGPRFLVLEGSRGCPYPCTFCSRVIQGKPLRQKSVEQLGREVETAVRDFGVRNIYFIDLEFTALPELVRGLCEYLLARKIRVRWCCQTRTDKIDEPLLRLMKRAGCRLIHFGVESGSPRIVEMTKKRVTIARQTEGVKLAAADWIGSALLLSAWVIPARRKRRCGARSNWPGGSVPPMLRFIASRPIRARRFTTSSRPAARSFFPHTPAARKIAAGWIA